MGMARLAQSLAAIVFFLIFSTLNSAQAQTLTYDVLVDLDRNTATGCEVPINPAPSMVNGIERRLRATVDSSLAMITSVTLEACNGVSFDAPVNIDGNYPVGLNNGINASDVIEMAVSQALLDTGANNPIQFTFVAQDSVGSDILNTEDGSPTGNAILFGFPIAVPALSALGIAILAVVLLILAWRHHRVSGSLMSVLLLVLAAGLVVAVNFIVDGNIDDWAGRAPRATDPIGDSTNGSAADDIQAAFIAFENNIFFFRLDIIDTENQAPIVQDDNFALLEDTTLNVPAPGVLGNDNDPNMDPFTAILVTGPSNAQSFTLNADGSFSYTPVADFNGADSFTYVADDGMSQSAVATVALTIDPVNDLPVAQADNAITNEDIQVDIDVLINDSDIDGNLDPSSVTVTVPVTNGNTVVNPANGVITYTKAPDFNGADSFQYQVCDDGTPLPAQCTTALVNITVNAVNDAPSFVPGAAPTVLEDAGPQVIPAWASAISPGPADEAGQILTFNVISNTNPALFAAGPSINANNGDLSFTSVADANGSADITIQLMDDGGTANGGIDVSAMVTFTITVTPVNDAPSFTPGINPSVLEDAGPQSINPWATAISPGPNDESAQNLNFNIVSNDNAALFSSQPNIDASGNLSFTAAANANGVANLMITLSDDGGTANGGVDTSAAVPLVITVTSVNDAPSFVAGPAVVIDEDSGAQNIAAWATGISAGPANEAAQILNFIITPNTTDPTLSFTAAPSIDPGTGNLQFTAAANAYGSASFNVVLVDNGGTANGGIDTFGPLNLNIDVTPINDPPTIAAAPSYTVTTNVQIDVPAASGLLLGASDDATESSDPSGPAAPGTNLTVGNGANPPPVLSANGGTVVINPTDGAFIYNPPPGFTGADSFIYVICDDGIGSPGPLCSAPINVQLNVSGVRVWYVDNTASGGANDGRLSEPFESLGAFNAQQNGGGIADPAAGDFIFIASAAAEYSDGANGITLLDDQTLFGQGTQGISFDAFVGYTPAPHSSPRPALGGTDPVISSSASSITLNTGVASTNTLRGLTIGNSTNGYALTGTVAGSLSVIDVDINGNGGVALLDGVNSGLLNVGLDNVFAANSQGPNALRLDNMGGGLFMTNSLNITNPSANAITLTNNPTTQFMFNNFANLITTSGSGIVANDSGMITIAAGAPPTIQTVGGPALDLSNTTTSGFNFSTVSASSTVSGVLLNNVTGFISSGGGTIMNTSGDAFVINGGTNSITYGGTIINNAGRAVVVTNHTGGNVVFNPITDSAQGIFLNNNAGTSFFFSGTLNLNTGANNAFVAMGGGTLDATGVNSSITTSTGTAIIVDSVSFRNTNFTVASVSSNGAPNGIMLNNTGTLGGLIVAGDGSNTRNGSGGTIQNTTGDAVLLADSFNLSLRSMNITNAGDTSDSASGGNILANNDHAIQSERGGNISLSGVLISNPAAGGWEAVDLGGINSIDNNSRIEGINVSNMQALEVRNTDTNMTSFTINNSEIANQATTNGSSFVIFSSFGTSNMTVIVENNSLFENLFGHAVQVNAGEGVTGTGTVNFMIANSTLQTAVDGVVGMGATGGLNGIVVSSRLDAVHNFDILGNTINDVGRPLANGGVVTIQGIGGLNKTLNGTFVGNNIDRIGYPTSAAATTTVGHRVKDVVTENDINLLDLESDNNDIDDTSREAFFISSRGSSSDFDVSLTNNRLGMATPIGLTDREAIEILSEDASDMEIDVINNNVIGNTSALDQVVDVDAENTSFMDMRFNNNTVSNVQAAGGFEITFDTENGTSTHCMEFTGNTAVDVEFDVNGTHNVEDFANIAANNPGVTNILDGVGVTNVAVGTCTHPSF